MRLLTKAIKTKLLKNGAVNNVHKSIDGNTEDFKPVVKFFGGAAGTWLISEMDPENPDILFGLCDLGFGEPEIGNVSLSELQAVRFKPFGLGIERDLWFKANKTLTEYAGEAHTARRIIA